jgi:hypothetical protein
MNAILFLTTVVTVTWVAGSIGKQYSYTEIKDSKKKILDKTG